MDTEGNTWKYLIFFDRYDGNSFNLTRNNGNPIKYQGFSKISPDIKKRVLELIETNTDSQWLISLLNINKIKLNTIIDNAFKYHKQVILTGAPGTGKTYCSKKYVQSQTNNDKSKYSFVQFHPSYDYSDFVEGLRPVVLNSDENDEPTFVRMDGVFKEFCRMVVMKNYSKMKEEHSNEQINDFNTLYKKYEDKQEEKYFFIIDEINRADLSKVFGELMYGLEESYRGIENSFNTQYKNLKTYTINDEGKAEPITFDCFEKGFFIPKNVYIIGTMNDIDKSVESFDFALRRRFEWIEIKVKDIIDSALSEMLPEANNTQIIDLKNRINTMNEVISTEGKDLGLSEAYHIGYAYFKSVNVEDESSLQEIFNHNIASILKEYTRGRDKDTIINFIEHCKQALLG